MSNLSEMYKFTEEWRHKENFIVLQNGHLQFSSFVNYSSPKFGVERGCCLVTVERTGPSDGNINILESSPFKTGTHHLGFCERYQTYKFNKSIGALVITGDSPKMGGKYEVSLIPDGKKVDWKPT
ncbi:MAG: hypothetical protein WC426_09365 [Sulfuriferula sp.]